MNIYGFIAANVRPIDYTYTLDQSVSSKNHVEYTREGLSIPSIDALNNLEDASVNKHNAIFLTDMKRVDDIFDVSPNPIQYPKYHTTHFKLSGRNLNWIVQPSTGTVSVTSTSVSNQGIFELELISPQYAAIRHYDNTTLKYLTLSTTSVSALMFRPRAVVGSITTDTQIFNYTLNKANNQITLFNILCSGGTNTPLIVTCTDNSQRKLSGSIIPNTYSLYTSANTFEILPFRSTLDQFNLNNTWYSYLSSVDDNNLLVSTSKSVTGIRNNLLITTSTNKIDSNNNTIDINVIPLKNQLTVESGQSRNNPYPDTTDQVTHRKYHGIYSGTHETGGLNNIHLTYTSDTKQIIFPPDKLTYFHTPQLLTPFVYINVNDTTLVRSGAVAGDTPIKSDKIFKKRVSENRNFIRDELNGTWLCAWLSGSSNPNVSPIWVDRYYNPNTITFTSALTSSIFEPVTYKDKFESIVAHLSARNSNITVFDKLSDLIIETGAQYAYHHIGSGNSQKVIDSLASNLIIDGIKTYKNYNFVTQVPDQTADSTTHTTTDGRLMTGRAHNIDSVEVPKVYSFNKDNYALTDTIDHKGSFTLNFWLHADNWNIPFANQVIGNFITKGFGIFNEPYVTPFITIPDSSRIHIYNTDLEYIDTHLLKQTVKCFTKRGSYENYWIVDTSNNIYEYTIHGVIQNRISSPLLTGKTIADIEVDDTFVYLLISPTKGIAEVFRYDLSNQVSGYTGSIISPVPIWNFAQTQNLSAARVFSVNTGNVASSGVIVTASDAISGIAAQENNITGGFVFGSTSVIDNNGKPWVLQNNRIYTYHAATSTIITALTASDIIEGIDCDRSNNIWVLHGYNKLTKLDNDRNKTFTVTLTSLLQPVSSVPYNKYIDFVSEFNNGVYRDYAIIINQSVSGCRAVKYDLDSNIHTDVNILTGIGGVRFFNTPMGLSGSWKSITGYDYLRRNKLNSQPRIEAKLSLTNLYNSTTTTATYSAYTLSCPVTGLTKGWHNFNISFDAEHGYYELKLNTVSIHRITIPTIKFSNENIFDQPLTIGSAPYYTRLVLFDFIKQSSGYLANGMKVKNVKLYDKTLTTFDINAHYMVEVNSTPLTWNIPIGSRNYVDSIERVFKARIPGRKSEKYNLNIKNTGITDKVVRKDLEQYILAQLESIHPINVKLKNIGWDNSFTSVSATNNNDIMNAGGSSGYVY